MYGLLLESFSNFIKQQWGEESWEAVRRHAGVESPTFCIHQIYAETLIPRLTRSAVQVLGVEERELFEAMGVYFVDFVGQFGYDQVMSVLGRHMRDFLNGLDNLHEYLKFSYPRMKPPSFFCENETCDGMILHYRSNRHGFVYYTMGQIKQVAKRFYDTDCDIRLLTEELNGSAINVTFELRFDNRAFIRDKTESLMYREEKLLPFRTTKLFELFPFCIVFSKDMIIRQTGYSLLMILKDLIGHSISEVFDMIRPMIPVTFASILERQNNSFELISIRPISAGEATLAGYDDSTNTSLRLRGQMLYIDEWKSIMFLAIPVMPDLDSLLAAGLFINDLSLHDCSRDFVLAGTQQSVELKLALHQEQLKTQKLEYSMKKLDNEMKRTDELLYQMIPKQVADRIRRGENPVDTCEVFEAVSILFSDVVTFTEICSRITPMLVVSMLNHMYSLFDQLTERNGVYKVETIGDSYMVVSGAPNKIINHAERICDMALDMIDASKGIFDPSRDGEHLKLRVGVHSGNVVAGVVGLKMPRWCLFGDTVNTSSRMESTSEACKIQISQRTRHLLPSRYETQYRGDVQMKGKGKMKTYWLISRVGRISLPLSDLEGSTVSSTAPVTPRGFSTTSISQSSIYHPGYYSDSSAEYRDVQVQDESTACSQQNVNRSVQTTQPFREKQTIKQSAKQILNRFLFPFKKKPDKMECPAESSFSQDLRSNHKMLCPNCQFRNIEDNETMCQFSMPRRSHCETEPRKCFHGGIHAVQRNMESKPLFIPSTWSETITRGVTSRSVKSSPGSACSYQSYRIPEASLYDSQQCGRRAKGCSNVSTIFQPSSSFPLVCPLEEENKNHVLTTNESNVSNIPTTGNNSEQNNTQSMTNEITASGMDLRPAGHLTQVGISTIRRREFSEVNSQTCSLL